MPNYLAKLYFYHENILNLGAAHRYFYLFVLFGPVPCLSNKLQPASNELKINSSNILQIHKLII